VSCLFVLFINVLLTRVRKISYQGVYAIG